MTKLFLFTIPYMFSLMVCIASCDKGSSIINDNDIKEIANDMTQDTNIPVNSNKIKISVGTSTFTATLLDNATTKAFKSLLPLKINMTELNNNEKYFDLAKSLPSNSTIPPSIQNGDLMLYGSRTLVLFYQSFSTSYSYTKLGKIDNSTSLAKALGNGNVVVSFEFQ